jgi:putative oxidoreductase
MVWRILLRTDTKDFSCTILRFTLAGVLFPHGVIKFFGDLENPKLMAGLDGLIDHVGLPLPLAVLVIAIEFLGPIMLVLGIAVRPVAIAIGVLMTVAATKHSAYFFMNWLNNQQGEGVEYHLLAIGICVALLIKGAGGLSYDALYSKKKRYSLLK